MENKVKYTFYLKVDDKTPYFMPYMEKEQLVIKDCRGHHVKTEVDTVWYTDDLEELQDKYNELLQIYSISSIKAVQELDVTINTTFEDASIPKYNSIGKPYFEI